MSWKHFRLHRWLCLPTPDSSLASPEVSLQGLVPADTCLCLPRRAAPWACPPPPNFPAGIPGVVSRMKGLNPDLYLKDWGRETEITICSVRASLAAV